MDNNKIGKLIAEQRKKKGLTQQELGDKVGVGFRAVSKWECGLTLPDISIINELSKILGISSDELLSGELTKENKTKKKSSPKLIILISTIITLIIISFSILTYNNNKTYTYQLESNSEEYYVEGNVTINKNELNIIINKLNFNNQELLQTKITNYDYQILADNRLIIGYGDLITTNVVEYIDTINKLTEIFRVNYNGRTTISKKELLENGITIKMSIVTKENKKIIKEIDMKLTNIKTNKNK